MSKFTNYSEIHCHIGSFDSGSTPEAFVKREIELGTGSICCSDHGTMTSCIDTYLLAKKNNLIPILGIESYIRDDNCPILLEAGIPKDENNSYKKYSKYHHSLIHCKDQKAFEFLGLKLSKADAKAEFHGSERKPIFNWQDMEEIGAYNITASSGCLAGVCGRHFLMGRKDLAVKHYEKIRGIVGREKFIVELFPHVCDTKWEAGAFITLENGEERKYWKGKTIRVERNGKSEDLTVEELSRKFSPKDAWKLIAIKDRQTWNELEPHLGISDAKHVEAFLKNECTPDWPDGDVQLGMNKFMYELAKKYNDRLMIAGDSHYAYPDEHVVQDIKLINLSGGLRFNQGYYRQSSDEAFEYFKGKMGITEKEFESWVDGSKEWADGFKNFTLDSPVSLPTKFYPENTTKHLKTLIDKHGRMRWNDEVWVKLS